MLQQKTETIKKSRYQIMRKTDSLLPKVTWDKSITKSRVKLKKSTKGVTDTTDASTNLNTASEGDR